MSQSNIPVTTPVPVPLPVTTPPIMWISSLPSSVLSWCLAPFLTDTDAVTVATCSKESFDAMQRAPYHIKNQLWWTTAEVIARLPSQRKEKSGAGVWLASSRAPQIRIGQLRRAVIHDARDALHMTSLIAALPKSVYELEVKSSFMVPATGLLNTIVYPIQLTSLLLSTVMLPKDSAPLDLPPNLHTLALPHCPDHPRWQDVFTALPESLHTLHLGFFAERRSFKDFPFPPHLTELNMGYWRGPIAELPALPTSLRKLVLPSFYHGMRELAKQLPSSLTELTFDNFVEDSLDDAEWPPSLRVMRFTRRFRQPLLNWRPPPVLETLDLYWKLPLSDLRLPATLQRLNLRGFEGLIDASYCWPPTLRALCLSGISNLPLSDVQWPVALEELDLMGWNLPSPLPPRLRKLRLCDRFNQSVEDLELPSTLEWLGFGDSFNQPVEGVLRLPMRLQQLHFGSGYSIDKFNQPLTNMQWPSSLQSLFLPTASKLPLEGLPRLLPPSLRALHRYESDDAKIESAWTAIVAALPRCETIIIRRPRSNHPCSQQVSFELFK